jgi:hypothetical protein
MVELPNRQTQIKTSLPYCLHKVDSRFFKIGDADKTKVRFTKKQTTPNRRTAASHNIEPIRDRWGIEAHSEVEILTDKVFGDETEGENFALRIINDFVRAYRYYDNEAVHLVPLIHEDLFGFGITNADGTGSFAIPMGGGLRVYNPMRTQRVSDSLEEFLIKREPLPLWAELLLNAQQYLYQADFRHSILETVIALEIVLSDFIRKGCATKGISSGEAEKFINDVGLTGNIQVSLKLLLDPCITVEDEIVKKCKAGITIRNKIVHEGRKDVSLRESEETIVNSRKLIDILLPLI